MSGVFEEQDPLSFYEAHLRALHQENVSACFEEMLRTSKVDEAQNEADVQILRTDQKQALKNNLRFVALRIWSVLYSVGALGLIVFIWCQPENMFEAQEKIVLIGGILLFLIAVLAWFRWWHQKRKAAFLQYKAKWMGEQEAVIAQTSPLNQLFEWDMALKLISKSFPEVQFDPYLSQERLQEFYTSFGWSGDLGTDRSVLNVHSGEFEGNPFLIGRTRNHWMGSKTYTGFKIISWTTTERGADGKMETRFHSETLTAQVTEPFPEYQEESFLLYANEAAPNLSFSRNISALSKLGDGKIARFRKYWAEQKLEKKSLQGQGNFTLMANREFDTLFGAVDRDDEVQFRLLFTPLAQQSMLKLLKNHEKGLGDNFTFIKDHQVNFVHSTLLSELDLQSRPDKFQKYDVQESRRFFNQYHNEFMKAFYFALAPILTIPLYRQPRLKPAMAERDAAAPPSFWEHEVIANEDQAAMFAHPESKTWNILKTKLQTEDKDSQKIEIQASGFKIVPQITYVTRRGGDGNYHNVGVKWDEYVPVTQISEMSLTRKTALSEKEPSDTANTKMYRDFLVQKLF